MDSTASTTSGLATPPLPVGQPLVYITGRSQANKQSVAECLALLLGDEAMLIDPACTSTSTPPPPNDHEHPSRARHKRRRLPSSAASPSFHPSSSSNLSRSRSTSTPTSTTTTTTTTAAAAAPPHNPPAPSTDPLLAALSSHPLRTAILTSPSHPPSPRARPMPPADVAAAQTGRPLILARLLPRGSSSAQPEGRGQGKDPTGAAAPQASAALDLREEEDGGDPHAAALRIVRVVKEEQARRHGRGDWEAVNERASDDEGGRKKGAAGTGYVCGVITPVLTPAEEKEMRF